MDMTVELWLVIVVNVTAAIAFLGIGSRIRNRFLLSVGIAFLVASLLVAAIPPFDFPFATAYGYAIGFAASVAGFLGLLKAFMKSKHP